MAMVTILDNGRTKVEVREDIAHEFEVCPNCHGKPWSTAIIAEGCGGWAFGGWSLYQNYRSCPVCDGGVVRRAKGEA